MKEGHFLLEKKVIGLTIRSPTARNTKNIIQAGGNDTRWKHQNSWHQAQIQNIGNSKEMGNYKTASSFKHAYNLQQNIAFVIYNIYGCNKYGNYSIKTKEGQINLYSCKIFTFNLEW